MPVYIFALFEVAALQQMLVWLILNKQASRQVFKGLLISDKEQPKSFYI
jgi:hypothetical protein